MLITVIASVAGLLAAAVLLLFLIQSRMVFIPGQEIVATPANTGLTAEEVWISATPGERLHAWYVPASPGAPVILLCHGNAGNISHRLESAMFFRSRGYGCLLFDYRGYGRSDGSPSEKGCYEDATAAFDWLVQEKQVPDQAIISFGRSLGGAVALELALRRSCRGLVIESSFTSVADMGKRMLPFLPVRVLLRYHFNSIGKIGDLAIPVLVTHSPDDETVPYEMGEALYAAAPQPKRFCRLSGGHNDREYFADLAYLEALDWITGHRMPDKE